MNPTGLHVLIRDAEQRRRIGSLYRKASEIAEAVYKARSRPAHLTEGQWQRMLNAGTHLWEHLGDAPVLLVPCLHQRDLPARDALDPAWRDHYDAERIYIDRIRGASIYPAVQTSFWPAAPLASAPLSQPITFVSKPSSRRVTSGT
jgi:hypothetical protein